MLRGSIGTACVLCEEVVALLAYLIGWLLLLSLIGRTAWLLLIICVVVEGHVLETGLDGRCNHLILGHTSTSATHTLRSSWKQVCRDFHLTHVIQAHHRFKTRSWRLINTMVRCNLWMWVQSR